MSNSPIGRYRWTICALLFAATTINYIDRQVIGLLKPTLTVVFGWDNFTFGKINGIFQFFYAFGLLGFGWLIHRGAPRLDIRSPLSSGACLPWRMRWPGVRWVSRLPDRDWASASPGISRPLS